MLCAIQGGAWQLATLMFSHQDVNKFMGLFGVSELSAGGPAKNTKAAHLRGLFMFGGPTRTRTVDQRIMSPLL